MNKTRYATQSFGVTGTSSQPSARTAFMISMLIAFTVLLAGLAGCGEPGQSKEIDLKGGKLKVVATTSIIADAVRVIGRDKVDLTALMGPGVDPHLYKATKGDVDRLSGAHIIFYNGLNLEAKMGEILGKMSGSKRTVAAAESIDSTQRRYPSEFKGHPDPHVWFDVSLWQIVLDTIAIELAKADPSNAAVFRANNTAYQDTLETLHSFVFNQVAAIPSDQRVMITAHDAFGYFGRAYGMEVIGLQGISTVSEAGLYDVTHMVDLIVERGIKAVFVESSVSRKSIEAVIEGCHAKGHDVEIGGELFSDAMGAEGTEEGTYVGMVVHNVMTLIKALH